MWLVTKELIDIINVLFVAYIYSKTLLKIMHIFDVINHILNL